MFPSLEQESEEGYWMQVTQALSQLSELSVIFISLSLSTNNFSLLFQDEKNQVLVTNVWLDQVRVITFLDLYISYVTVETSTRPELAQSFTLNVEKS